MDIRVNGTVRIYYDGHGLITGDDGKEYYLHYKNLADGKDEERLRGARVSFNALDEGKDHLAAADVTVIERRPKLYPTGESIGTWLSTNEKGRIRCSSCGRTTDVKPSNYCPHCGVPMIINGKAVAESNADNIEAQTPDGKWNTTENGWFRCNRCQKLTIFSFKYCPHCGKFMEKLRRRIE